MTKNRPPIIPRSGLRLPFLWAGLTLALAASLLCTAKPFVKVFFPNGTSITAELAVTEEERLRGLMFRQSINDDQGMLFIFEREATHAFWMKNVKFPIDILYLDRDKRIVHIEARVPPCPAEPCPSYPSLYPSMYVLELKSGGAEARGLKVFDRIEFVLPKDLR